MTAPALKPKRSMFRDVLEGFGKGFGGTVLVFFIVLTILSFLVGLFGSNAEGDEPVRPAELGEQDRSVSGSQHLPRGTRDHDEDWLRAEIAISSSDVDGDYEYDSSDDDYLED